MFHRARIAGGEVTLNQRSAATTARADAASPSRPPTSTTRSFATSGSNAAGFSTVSSGVSPLVMPAALRMCGSPWSAATPFTSISSVGTAGPAAASDAPRRATTTDRRNMWMSLLPVVVDASEKIDRRLPIFRRDPADDTLRRAEDDDNPAVARRRQLDAFADAKSASAARDERRRRGHEP